MYSDMEQTASMSSQFSMCMHQVDKDMHIEVDEVRITPGAMIFEGAYDTKTYKEKIVITNCGKMPAYVRMSLPTSYSFKIKPQIRELFLPAGLSLTRVMRYTHQQHASPLPYSTMDIFINGKCVEYKLVVKLSSTIIKVEPQLLNFGTLNCGHTLYTRTLTLINDGLKNGRYAIDLGRNHLELIVEPRKGLIKAKSSVTLNVEVISNKVGKCEQEFWVKCETPIFVKVSVTFIEPMLVSCHPNASKRFTLIVFPPTYFRTRLVKTFVVQNVGASGAVFCTMAEVNDNVMSPMTFSQAETECEDFKNFQMWPQGGHLVAYEGRIFQILYKPKKKVRTRKGEYYENHSICVALILRIDCKDLHKIDFQGNENLEAMNLAQESALHFSTSLLSQDVDFNEDIDFEKASTKYSFEMESPEVCPIGKYLRVLLYGYAQTANVILRPDAFDLGTLQLKQTTIRELLIKNVSRDLPIFFKYIKVPFVKIIPKKGRLEPSESLEVEVRVNPGMHGRMSFTIVFDLLYYNRPRLPMSYVKVGESSCTIVFNVDFVTTEPKVKFVMGITPHNNNEVGFLTETVKFNTPIAKPRAAMGVERINKFRNDSDFIAFPNDRPKGLRPWKNKTICKTIFGGFPRVMVEIDDYDLSKSREELKTLVNKLYTAFYRRVADLLRKPKKVDCDKEYAFKKSEKILAKISTLPDGICGTQPPKDHLPDPSFLPMDALQLYNVVVSPRRITLEKIAAYSQFQVALSIKNNNNFKIRVYMKPCALNTLGFPDGNRRIIKAMDELEVNMTYYAMAAGRQNVTMDVIINESHGYDVTLLTEVVPRYIQLSRTEFEFISNEANTVYIELSNPSNIAMPFQWETHNQCFAVEPFCGCLDPKRKVLCQIMYTPHASEQIASEILLVSNFGFQQVLKVYLTLVMPQISFEEEHLEVESIPLNLPITRDAILRNPGHEAVSFRIQDCNPLPGVSISPAEGVCPGRGFVVIHVFIHLSALMSFEVTVGVEVQRIFNISLTISGTVEYPNVIIKPPTLKLRKIIVGSFDRLGFLVENHGDADVVVSFNFTEFPEFYVAETASKWASALDNEGFILKPKCAKNLFLHYIPVDVGPNKFFLPVVLNGVLGPVYKNYVRSHAVSWYLKTFEETYQEYKTVKILPTPQKVAVTDVETVAAFQVLKFSSYDFYFSYSPHPFFQSVTSGKLVITNVSDDVVDFCVRTDDLLEPFSVLYEEEDFIPDRLQLQPKESLSFIFTFAPDNSGKYEIYLPVYVREKLEGNVFNLIKLWGESFAPEIIVSSPVYLEPVPLKITSERFVTLKLCHHESDCELSFKSSDAELYIIFSERYQINPEKLCNELQIRVGFNASEPIGLQSEILIYCSCGSECTIKVFAASDNCSLTNHAYLATKNADKTALPYSEMDNKNEPDNISELQGPRDTFSSICSFTGNLVDKMNVNETSFPAFPEESEQMFYSKYMTRTNSVLEDWIFTQGFKCNFHYTVPLGIRTYPVSLDMKKKEKGKGKGKKAPPVVEKKKDAKDDGKDQGKSKKEKGKKKAASADKKAEENQESKKKEKGNKILSATGKKKGDKEVHEKNQELVFVQLLVNLVGKHILKQIMPMQNFPQDAVGKIAYNYSIYCNIIEMLGQKGAFMPHVKSEYLLQYSDYVTVRETILPMQPDYDQETMWEDIIDETTFNLLNQQNWLDLLLQTYKVFILKNVCSLVEPSPRESKSAEISPIEAIPTSSEISVAPVVVDEFVVLQEEVEKGLPNVYSEDEIVLLKWLSVHMEQQRLLLWSGDPLLEKKRIQNFDSNLMDSLALIAVTTSYCPYTVHLFDGIYLFPQTQDQAFHNAALLTKTFTLLNFSFKIPPMDIVIPNAIQMLLLVTYLFEVLPSLTPSENVRLEAPLSQEIRQDFAIKNESAEQICYKLVFFDNDLKCFSAHVDTMVIKPHERRPLGLKYWAKKLKTITAVLVLTGDTQGYKYAKGIALNLEGVPDVKVPILEFEYVINLYETLQIEPEVQAPYRDPSIYDIYVMKGEFSEDEQGPPTLIPWKEIKDLGVPRMLYTVQEELVSDSSGKATLQQMLNGIIANVFSEYLYFLDKDGGDFCIRYNITITPESMEYEEVDVIIPKGYMAVKCVCPKGETLPECPRIFEIDMPRRNYQMWNCIENVFMNTLHPSEQKVWSQYLGTTTGCNLLSWMFKRDPVSQHSQYLLRKSVTFTFNSSNTNITFPEFLTIDDVNRDDPIKVRVHIKSADIPNEIQLTMICTEEIEHRFYKLLFSVTS